MRYSYVIKLVVIMNGDTYPRSRTDDFHHMPSSRLNNKNEFKLNFNSNRLRIIIVSIYGWGYSNTDKNYYRKLS